VEIIEAQKAVDKAINQYGGYWQPLSMMARLVEEVGELARAMNIKHGDKRSKHESDGREIEEELTDVLFTTLAIANKEDINLDKLIKDQVDRKLNRDKETYTKWK